MKAKDLREKSLEDLYELEKALKKDGFSARFKNFTARLDDTSSIRKARRDIARVKTLILERKNGGAAKVAPKAEAKPVVAKAAAPKKAAKAAAPAAAAAAAPAKEPKAPKKATAKKTAKSEASK
jgi:large subunit ribosomal protein L29